MKAFVIGLTKIESSKTSGLETLSKLKEYGFDTQWFEGTYGNDAEELFKKENRTLFNPERHAKSKSDSPGAKGCFHSHYRLWQQCVQLNEPIAIFEDDIVFKRNFEPIPFEEVLILTINYDWKITKDYRKYFEEDFPINTIVDYKNYCIPGASGYVITPAAAKKLVDCYQNHYLTPDWAINTELLKVTIHPRLMGRSKTYDEKESLTRSTIWNKNK
jgi:glycosyl transferase, family 25